MVVTLTMCEILDISIDPVNSNVNLYFLKSFLGGMMKQMNMASCKTDFEHLDENVLNNVLYSNTPQNDNISNDDGRPITVFNDGMPSLHKIELGQQTARNIEDNPNFDSPMSSTSNLKLRDWIEPEIIESSSSEESESDLSLCDQESRIKSQMGSHGTFFQKNYGLRPTSSVLNEYITVRKFQRFFKDMTKKFEITHKFMEIHKEHIMNIESRIQEMSKGKLSVEKFISHNKQMSTVIEKIKADVKDLAKKDPDAALLVQYTNGGCKKCTERISMRAPAAPIEPLKKGAFIPNFSLRSKIACDNSKIENNCKKLPENHKLDLPIIDSNPRLPTYDRIREMFEPKTARQLKKILQSKKNPVLKISDRPIWKY